MKFKIQVKKVGSDNSWWEEYEENISDPQKWAEEIISEFNDSLREGEKAREVISVEIIKKDTTKNHSWDKTNAGTLQRGGEIFDKYECNVCGVTGKRFGIGGNYVKRDHEYKAKVYRRCDTALAHIEKRGRRHDDP